MSVSGNGHRTEYRTCPLCEATCGLEITLDGERVESIRGDKDDVFSHGFICPKGFALKELHDDPDRVRTPLIRQPDGSFAPASWDEAFALIDERLSPILAGDRNAAAVYFGNPSAHNLSNLLYGRVLIRALGTRNNYSASTVDQFPKQMASAADVRHRHDRAGARRRPDRLPADARRQPAAIERQPDDRARLRAAGCARSAPAAASWS